jgi:hypothetical protein
LRLVLIVISLALAVGVLRVGRTIYKHQHTEVASATMHVRAGGIAVRFPVSLNTQEAADVSNWNVSTLGSEEALAVQAAVIGTDDRSTFLEIIGLKPDVTLKVRYNLHGADGAVLHGTLTGRMGE